MVLHSVLLQMWFVDWRTSIQVCTLCSCSVKRPQQLKVEPCCWGKAIICLNCSNRSCILESHKARTACTGHREIKIHSDLFPHWVPEIWAVRCFSGILPEKVSNQTTLIPGFSASDFWHFKSGNSVLSGVSPCTAQCLHNCTIYRNPPTVTTKNVSKPVLPYILEGVAVVGKLLPKTKAPES